VPRILVADDNTNIQKMVVLAFQERGVEVIAVGNGEAAVRRLPDANPDLVLADVFMPVRNGYEVCEFVKKDPRFSHVPVILLVGAFDPLDEKEARRVGADGVLKKPFVPPDPLIAMVMSALEKNPKVAAELAKAKEVAAEALLPPALPEVPLKAEPKPLPEFPEPTAEEAAVIYGFGKGVRAIDLDEVEEDDEEPAPKASKIAKTSKDSKAPKAPAAPKTPVVAAIDDDDDDDDEFDGSATANDWRRNAADFEVPENVAADPIYSYGRNFEPITFPSERDVPPRRRKTDENGAEETAAQETAAKIDAPAAKEKPAAEIVPAPVQASAEPAAKSNPWDVKEDQPEIELAAGFTRVEEPDTQAKYLTREIAKPSQLQRPAAAPPAVQHHEATQEATPEPPPARPTLVSRMRGWMDMLTPSSPETAAEASADASASDAPSHVADTSAGHSTDASDSHWMNNLSAAPAPASPTAHESAPVAASSPAAESVTARVEAAPASAAPFVDQAAETQPIIVATAFAATEAPSPAAPNADFAPTANAESNVAAPVEAPGEVLADVREEVQPRQFSESAQGGDKFGGSSYHFSDDAPNEIQAELHEPAPSAAGAEGAGDYSASHTVSAGLNAEAEPEPITSSAADFSPEFTAEVLPAPADVPVNGGGLSGMLPAEPLFGSQPLHDAADYSKRDEDQAPPCADTREQDAFAADTHPGQLPQPAPSRDYWDREAAAHEAAILAKSSASLFSESAAPAEPPAPHNFERIPTLPPPNREALSEIPFLMPPLLPPQNSEQPAARANDAEAVDAMVRKVMEKLGPHLQELLSQGVKPLVENLLQNELHKKER
jgi:CheY-like chemotaxis protein